MPTCKRSIVLLLCVLYAVLGTLSWAASPTKSLPIVYVDTKGQAINDTETKVPATVYIDPLQTGYEALGSSSAPITGTIKGRGNYTWKDFDKRPYKIKFDTKQKVLGLPNNKHWCLLAGADDDLGFLRNPAGHILSQIIGLRWTPHIIPVELVLNGKYQGLYFLAEHVRIAKNRVNIHEQKENETNPDSISGGWLVEIDNYASEGNIVLDDIYGRKVMISLKEPEILSAQQREYLVNHLSKLHTDIEGTNQDRLEKQLDIDEAAKYYLVQEIMEDCESYHGSCFLYKDIDSLGVEDKWKFGPVWDFGNAYYRHQDKWIYVDPPFGQYWIEGLNQFPAFQKKVKEYWYTFYHSQKDAARAEIRAFANTIEKAAKTDSEVWRNTRNYKDNGNYSDVRDRFFRRFDWRVNWLYDQWGEGIRPVSEDIEQTESGAPKAQKILRNGTLYIRINDQWYNITGQKIL